jgi:hypothetical protein
MQELHNLVLLQLHRCTHLTVLNLQGLHCLCHLELVKLPKLDTITLIDHSEEDAGTYDSLHMVYLKYLSSLKRMPVSDLGPGASRRLDLWGCFHFS